MPCKFQLEQYQLASIAVCANEAFDDTLKSHGGELTTSITFASHKTDERKKRLTLDVAVRPDGKNKAAGFPYDVAIKGHAFFIFEEPCSAEEKDHFMSMHGAAILYGLLRAQVAQITAQSVNGQFLLPTMNFAEADEKRKIGEPEKTAERRPATRRMAKGS
jgi:preprotein translocase subunit SecB